MANFIKSSGGLVRRGNDCFNFKYGNALPQNVQEGGVFVVTDIVPKTWYLYGYEPSDPELGDIYFFNVAVTKYIVCDNVHSVMARYGTVWQWMGAQWAEVDAYLEVDGVWDQISQKRTLPLLESYSWLEISQICNENRHAELFKLGDGKRVSLSNGEVINLQIAGIDHDYNSSITFLMQHCLNDVRGIGARGGGNETRIDQTELQNFLDGEIFNLLPSDLQSIIKQTRKKVVVKNTGGSGVTHDINCKLFVLSEGEIFTANELAKKNFAGYGDAESIAHYSFFRPNVMAKKKAGAEYCSWWTRTAAFGTGQSAYAYSVVKADGTDTFGENNTYGENQSAHGVCFGLCI